MRTGMVLIVIAVVGFAGSPARGQDGVLVESKTVVAGRTDSLGVYINNGGDLIQITVPLEIRTVESGAYIADSLTLEIQGRLAVSELVNLVYYDTYGLPDSTNSCSGPVSQTYSTTSPINFESPDAFRWVGISTSTFILTAGSDGSPDIGVPSMLLRFGINGFAGTFEIDTCCITPAHHLLFATNIGLPPVVSFLKGVITVVENPCSCHGDPVCDSVINVLDVVAVIDDTLRAFGLNEPAL